MNCDRRPVHSGFMVRPAVSFVGRLLVIDDERRKAGYPSLSTGDERP